MTKIAIIGLLVALLSANIGWAEDTCRVSGEVQYSGDADIHVCLFDSKTFQNVTRALPQHPYLLVIKARQSGKTSFVFDAIPRGEYLILAFVDENRNGRADCTPHGFIDEPSCMYRSCSMERGVNWYDQKFVLDKDIDGIVLNLYR